MFTCSISGTTYDCKTDDLCPSFLLAVFYFLHRGKTDKQPAGTIKLDVTCKCVIILNDNAVYYMFACTDCVCEMEAGSKSYPNCFTVGPVIDDGATRTFFISCCKCNNYYACIKAHKLCLVCTCMYICVCCVCVHVSMCLCNETFQL